MPGTPWDENELRETQSQSFLTKARQQIDSFLQQVTAPAPAQPMPAQPVEAWELPSLRDLSPWRTEPEQPEISSQSAPGSNYRQITVSSGGTPVAMPTTSSRPSVTISDGRAEPAPGLQPGETVGNVSISGPSREIDNSSRESFVRTAYPSALEAADGDARLAQQLLATAISENGAVGTGRSLGEMGFNVGGIQGVKGPAGSFWASDAGNMREFAAYNNLSEGFRAVRDLITGSSLYRDAYERYRQSGDIDRFWQEMNAAGYAEDANWHSKVGSIRRNQVEPHTQGTIPPPEQSPGGTPIAAPHTPDDGHEHADDYEVAFGFNQAYSNPFNPAIPRHRGVDLVVRGAKDGGRGSPVKAFRGGTVVAVTKDPNGGNGIILQDDQGLYHRYFHFDSMSVEQGQRIEPGQQIGVLGASGTEGFPHVHFEVSKGINGDPMDQLIDPTPYMRAPAGQQGTAQQQRAPGTENDPVPMASGDEPPETLIPEVDWRDVPLNQPADAATADGGGLPTVEQVASIELPDFSGIPGPDQSPQGTPITAPAPRQSWEYDERPTVPQSFTPPAAQRAEAPAETDGILETIGRRVESTLEAGQNAVSSITDLVLPDPSRPGRFARRAVEGLGIRYRERDTSRDQAPAQSVIDRGLSTGEAIGNAVRRGTINTRVGVLTAAGEAARRLGAPDVADWFEEDANRVERYLRENPQVMRRATKDVFDSPFGIVEAVAESLPSVAPTLLAAVVSGGGSLGAQAATGLARGGLALGALASAGSTSRELREDVKAGRLSQEMADVVSVGAGLVEYLTERLFPGADRKLIDGLAGDVGRQFAEEIKTRGLRGLARTVARETGQEAVEEALAESYGVAIDAVFKDEKKRPTLEEAARRIAGAAAVGGVFGAGISTAAGAPAAIADEGARRRVRQDVEGARAQGRRAAGALLESLVERGVVSADYLAEHPPTTDRVLALMSIAAEGKADDEVIVVPGLATALAKLDDKAKDELADLLSGPVTAGQVRARLRDPKLAERAWTATQEIVADLLSGQNNRGQRRRESQADESAVRGLPAHLREAAQELSEAPRGDAEDSFATPYGRARRTEDDDVLRFVDGVAREMGLPEAFSVFLTRSSDPFAAAGVRPNGEQVVILSSGLANAGLTEEELRSILKHEMSHLGEQSAETLASRRGGGIVQRMRQAIAGSGPARLSRAIGDDTGGTPLPGMPAREARRTPTPITRDEAFDALRSVQDEAADQDQIADRAIELAKRLGNLEDVQPVAEAARRASTPMERAASRRDLVDALDSGMRDLPHRPYSSTQLDIGGAVGERITDVSYNIKGSDLADDGRELEPHVTVKYGLTTSNADDVRKIVEAHGPITVTLGKTSVFEASETGGEYDVVKVDVESPQLRALNAELAKLPNQDRHPEYKPHVTLAYVTPGRGKAYAGMTDLEGEKVTINELTFSSKTGDRVTIPLKGEASATPNPGIQTRRIEASEPATAAPRATDEDIRQMVARAAGTLPANQRRNGLTSQQWAERAEITPKAAREAINTMLARGEMTATGGSGGGTRYRYDGPTEQPKAGPKFNISYGGTTVAEVPREQPAERTTIKAGQRAIYTTNKGVEQPVTAVKRNGNQMLVRFENGHEMSVAFDRLTPAEDEAPAEQEAAPSTRTKGNRPSDVRERILGQRIDPKTLQPKAPIQDQIAAREFAGQSAEQLRKRLEVIPGQITGWEQVKENPQAGERRRRSADAAMDRLKYEMNAIRRELARREQEEDEKLGPATEPRATVETEGERDGSRGRVSDPEQERTRGADRGALADARPRPVSRAEAERRAGDSGAPAGGRDAGGRAEPTARGADRPGGVGGRDAADRARVAPAERLESAPAVSDVVMTDDDLAGRTPVERWNDNLAALRILMQLRAEGRGATIAEQRILARYSGFGDSAFEHAFRPAERKPNAAWKKRGDELRALVPEAEYEAIRESRINANYTSAEVVSAMWGALQRMGLTGPNLRVLDPSSGSGRFFGMMPPEMAQHASRWMVELDTMTGELARALFPQASVQITGFEQARIPDNSFDLAISNVPFSDAVRIGKGQDPSVPANLGRLALHNYFFFKALQAVRPGGVVAFVTTHNTLDAKTSNRFRRYLAGQADFVGAIRLPQDAFVDTAVTTDIVFLKKRAPGDAEGRTPWTETEQRAGEDGTEYDLNEYFIDHPEMALGQHSTTQGRGLYRGSEYRLIKDPGLDMAVALNAAIGLLPADIFTPAVPDSFNADLEDVQAAHDSKPGAYVVRQGKLGTRVLKVHDPLTKSLIDPPNMTDAAKARVIRMMDVRDAARSVLARQLDPGASDASVKQAQGTLQRAYDGFVREYGPLSEVYNQGLLRTEPDAPLLRALERRETLAELRKRRISEGRKITTGAQAGKVEPKAWPKLITAADLAALKMPIFTERVITPVKRITKAETPADALAIVLNERGAIDAARMSELLGGKPRDEILGELTADGVLFHDPDGGHRLAEEYLSGDVVAKLARAEEAAETDGAFSRNVEALKAVQPAPLKASEVSIRLGAPWVPEADVNDFVQQLLEGRKPPGYRYVPALGQWTREERHYEWDVQRALNRGTYGTDNIDAINIIDRLLAGRDVVIRKPDPDDPKGTRTIVDADATQKAQAKVREIRTAWTRWLRANPERLSALVDLYNDKFNREVPRAYDGKHLTFPGMAQSKPPRDHQRNVVWRVIQQGTVLMAHEVGAGKTIAMAASAMELRRLGLSRKNLFVVPNHLVGQFAQEFLSAYPSANVLVPRPVDFQAKNRQELMARIATGDYDAIVVAQSQFTLLPISEERQTAMIQAELAELEAALREEEAARGYSRQQSQSEKELVKAKKRLESRLKDMQGKIAARQDKALTFEDLGIDALFVDEADLYKNLQFVTKKTRVKGLPNAKSQRAFDMHAKTTIIREGHGGRGVVFATGTPVSNTIAELWTMLRYLTPDTLRDLDIDRFDAWADTFGDTVTQGEMTVTGKFQMVTRFAQFQNAAELNKLFQVVADIVTEDDMPELAALKPKLRGGERIDVTIPPTPELQAYMKSIEERANNLKNVDPTVDNMLKISSDARKAALDIRLVNPRAAEQTDGKVDRAAEKIAEVWKREARKKGTQIVFLDMGTPKALSDEEIAKLEKAEADSLRAAGSASEDAESVAEEEEVELGGLTAEEQRLTSDVYNRIKAKLTARGIPAGQIAFIHDAKTKVQKQKLFDSVNDGTVRVLLGSTEKLGAGTNVQARLAALHHIDAPWRPRDVEQREGRILRQGNKVYGPDGDGSGVEIYRYLTEGSFDSVMWSGILAKARAIKSMVRRHVTARTIEDADEFVLSAAQAAALATGNPDIVRYTEMQAELAELEGGLAAHQDAAVEYERILARTPYEIAELEAEIAALTTASREIKAEAGKGFAVTIGGRRFDARETAAYDALVEAIRRAYGQQDWTPIATLYGSTFEARMSWGQLLEQRLVRPDGTVLGIWRDRINDISGRGKLQAIERASSAAHLDERVKLDRQLISRKRSTMESAERQKAQAGPFEQLRDLERLRADVPVIEAKVTAPPPDRANFDRRAMAEAQESGEAVDWQAVEQRFRAAEERWRRPFVGISDEALDRLMAEKYGQAAPSRGAEPAAEAEAQPSEPPTADIPPVSEPEVSDPEDDADEPYVPPAVPGSVYHETDPRTAAGFINEIGTTGLIGMYVTPDPALALGQGGRGALVEMTADDLDTFVDRKKPGARMMEAAGQGAPERVIRSHTKRPAEIIRSITIRPGIRLGRVARAQLGNSRWRVEDTPDGGKRYVNPALEQSAPSAVPEPPSQQQQIVAALDNLKAAILGEEAPTEAPTAPETAPVTPESTAPETPAVEAPDVDTEPAEATPPVAEARPRAPRAPRVRQPKAPAPVEPPAADTPEAEPTVAEQPSEDVRAEQTESRLPVIEAMFEEVTPEAIDSFLPEDVPEGMALVLYDRMVEDGKVSEDGRVVEGEVIAPETVRLYRGQETPPDGAPSPSSGNWFTDSIETAQWYVDNQAGGNGVILYVDVPKAVADAARRNPNGELEWFLPNEWAARAQLLGQSSGQAAAEPQVIEGQVVGGRSKPSGQKRQRRARAAAAGGTTPPQQPPTPPPPTDSDNPGAEHPEDSGDAANASLGRSFKASMKGESKRLSPGMLEAIRRAYVRAMTDDRIDLNLLVEEIEQEHGELPPEFRVDLLARMSPGMAAKVTIDEGLKPHLRGLSESDLAWLDVFLTHMDNIDVAKAMGLRAEQETLDAAGPFRGKSYQRLVTERQRLRAFEPGGIAENPEKAAASAKRVRQLERAVQRDEVKHQQTVMRRAARRRSRVESERLFSEGLTVADSHRALGAMARELGAARLAKIQRAAVGVWEFNRSLLRAKVENDVISQELYDELVARYPHYVPTRIVDYLGDHHNDGPAVGRSLSLSDTGLRRNTLEGTRRRRENPLASTYRNAIETERTVKQNQVALAMKLLIEADPDGLGEEFREAPAGYTLRAGEGYLTGYERGVKFRYVTGEPMAAALKTIAVSPVHGFFRSFMHFWKELITRFPLFIAYQVPQDAASYTLREMSRADGNPLALPGILADLVVGYGIAFRGLLSGEYRGSAASYLKSGGGMAGFNMRDVDTAKEHVYELAGRPSLAQLVKRGVLFQWSQAIGERTELAPRVASYRRAQRDGLSEVEATIAGRDVTLDFLRGGYFARYLNGLLGFFNVGAQASATIPRMWQENPKGFVLMSTMMLGAGVLLEALLGGDDDEWEDVPQYIKDRGLLFPTGGTSTTEEGERRPRFVLLPVRELAPLLIVGREIVRRLSGQEGRAPLDLILATVTAASPIQANSASDLFGGFFPEIIATPAQLAMDYDWFRGGPIRTQRNDAQASNLATWVAHALQFVGDRNETLRDLGNVTPAQVEFAARGVGGHFARTVGAASDVGRDRGAQDRGPIDTPLVGGLVGRFVTDAGGERLRTAQQENKLIALDVRRSLREARVNVKIGTVRGTIENVPLHRNEQARYQELANSYTDRELRSLLRSGDFRSARGSARAKLVSEAISRGRQTARQQVLDRIPSFEQERRRRAAEQKAS